MQTTGIICAVRLQIYICINTQSRWLSNHFGFSNISLSKCYYKHNVHNANIIQWCWWYILRKKKKYTMLLSHSSVLEWVSAQNSFIRSTMLNQSLWLDYWTFSYLFSHKIGRSAYTHTLAHTLDWHTYISFFVSAQIEFAVAEAVYW